jgi:hypothetical protein
MIPPRVLPTRMNPDPRGALNMVINLQQAVFVEQTRSLLEKSQLRARWLSLLTRSLLHSSQIMQMDF